MNIARRLKNAQERDDIIRAIQGFDFEALQSLIDKGADIKRLVGDKKLVWHLQRNFLPEAYNLEAFSEDEREQLNEISQRLSKGNEILKILAHAGLLIPDIGKNYAQYSLYELEEKYFNDDDVDISRYNARAIINYERFKYSSVKNPEVALWQATSPEALRTMLADGVDVNICDSSGWTALHHIAFAPTGKYFRPVEMIKILIEAGADVNARSKDQITPLMVALNGLAQNLNASFYDDYYKNNIKIVALFVKSGADTKAHDRYNNDIYFWADIDSHKELKSFIEEIAAYPRLSEYEFDFITAVLAEDLQSVKEVLSRKSRVNINLQTISGYTPLMLALSNNENDLITYLLELGAEPNIQNKLGETALYQAVYDESDINKIEILLNNGADPNIKDTQGNASLNLIFNQWRNSLNHKALRISKLLLESGADPDSREKGGITPLMRCVCLENYDEYNGNIIWGMKFLLEAGADINARDNEGSTPLR